MKTLIAYLAIVVGFATLIAGGAAFDGEQVGIWGIAGLLALGGAALIGGFYALELEEER